MELNKIYQGDCLEIMKEIPDNYVDAIVTDPPYGLSFMGKKWDYDVPSVEIWKECLRVLKPGGYLLAFAGTRTQHRMACNIEDAGFEIRDMIAWVYGSGFPKSLNIGKAVDKLQGNEREVIEVKKQNGAKFKTIQEQIDNGGFNSPERENFNITKGTSEWEGWGTSLKPALEPITVARKPLSEKNVAENVFKWGTGGMNIDACRVFSKDVMEERTRHGGGIIGNGTSYEMPDSKNTIPPGRFPANFIHDGSDEVLSLFPNSKSIQNKKCDNRKNKGNSMFLDGFHNPENSYNDSGSAARFFYCAKASKNERLGLDKIEIIIHNVTNKYGTEGMLCKEKNLTQEEKLVHLQLDMDTLTPKVIAEYGIQNKSVIEWSISWFGKNLMEKYQKDFASIILTGTNLTMTSKIYNWLVFLLTKEYTADVNLLEGNGGNLVENADNLKELIISINEKMASRLGVKNAVSKTLLKISVKGRKIAHCTQKPLKLMEYLIKLVSREGAMVLDPFAGSGTTGMACKKLNRNFILIEREPKYCKIAEKRINSIGDK